MSKVYMDYKGACHDGFCNSPSSRQFEVLYPVGLAAYLPRLGRLFPVQLIETLLTMSHID